MKYLVMECHMAYAVVMDPQGRFLRVANQHFEVGQTVEDVIPLLPAARQGNRKGVLRLLAVTAACLCLILLGTWQVLSPYGTVRMQINPDVKVTVNRLNYVIDVTPLNADGHALLAGYDPGIQKIDAVLDQLADRALDMGYLASDGQIRLTVESSHKKWQTATQDRLIAELDVHTGGTVTVSPSTDPIPDDDWDEDDWDDDDDDDDEDDDDEDEDDDLDDDEDDD